MINEEKRHLLGKNAAEILNTVHLLKFAEDSEIELFELKLKINGAKQTLKSAKPCLKVKSCKFVFKAAQTQS